MLAALFSGSLVISEISELVYTGKSWNFSKMALVVMTTETYRKKLEAFMSQIYKILTSPQDHSKER